jgi:hypothetical protein
MSLSQGAAFQQLAEDVRALGEQFKTFMENSGAHGAM